MHQPRTAASVLHLPRRTLRTQLALLYAALFCISAVALAAVAEIFKPNFLVHTGSQAAPGTPGSLAIRCPAASLARRSPAPWPTMRARMWRAWPWSWSWPSSLSGSAG